tara:strand:- start:3 stop:242 length:240 start_codon:yes stop_codon:yes gene_type:complete
MNNLIKYYEIFNKSMLANKALKDFQGGDNAEFTRLQRNATRYHNDCEKIRAEFTAEDQAVYNSVKDAWVTYESIFVKGK